VAKRKIKDSVITITGGTGSFGSTMVGHLLDQGAQEIRIFSRDEAKQDAMRHQNPDPRLRFYIGDTRDLESVDRAIKGSDLVFHAAALKQVPSAEFFPLEAVKTNINGSANVLRSSIEHGVKSVVCLSTDKAVYPINAMGMTKAVMEKTAQAFARDNQDSETTIAITRYGNVMYSRGSVIPLFIEQIKSDKPITITDPTMTRFLMSLAESVDLVKHAFENAQTGDLFVRKAPASTIEDLAKALIELFGTGKEQIKAIGFRHGEKLYESLLSTEERAIAQDLGGYFRVPLDTRDLNYSVFFEQGESRPAELDSYTSHNTERLDVEGVKKLLLTIPEIRQALGK
jgi:UDP-N-acetylglucosamine 4,6-dehydratase/5-epimerase